MVNGYRTHPTSTTLTHTHKHTHSPTHPPTGPASAAANVIQVFILLVMTMVDHVTTSTYSAFASLSSHRPVTSLDQVEAERADSGGATWRDVRVMDNAASESDSVGRFFFDTSRLHLDGVRVVSFAAGHRAISVLSRHIPTRQQFTPWVFVIHWTLNLLITYDLVQ